MEKITPWIPTINQLIWPVFIIIMLISFKSELEGLYQMATEGRSLKIGGWIEIGEQIKTTEIQKFAKEDMTVEAFAGSEEMVTKGGSSQLEQLQEKLRRQEIKHIDVMAITDNIYYSKDMLLKYISVLGIKQVVFIQGGRFSGWMESSVFSGQVFNYQRQTFDYYELKNLLAGIENTSVKPSDKTDDVLNLMKAEKIENVPVVEGEQFKYFVNKSDILATLVSNAILQ
jgi:hypothetical protein